MTVRTVRGLDTRDLRGVTAAVEVSETKATRRKANATRDYATIGFDDEGPTWMFVYSKEPGEGRNRLMLDLGGEEDWREQANRVEALGATRIAEHEVTE